MLGNDDDVMVPPGSGLRDFNVWFIRYGFSLKQNMSVLSGKGLQRKILHFRLDKIKHDRIYILQSAS